MSSSTRVPPARDVSRSLRPNQPTAVVLAVIGFLAVVVFCTVAGLVAIPPSLVNISSSASDGSTPYPLESAGADIDVVVPTGWIVRREGEGVISVDTPDGGMTARIDLVDEDPEAAVSDHPGLATVVRSEVLASGRAVVHADAADRVVVAAVGVIGRALSPSVRVVATVEDTSSMTTYRPALAELLEGIGG